MSKGAYKALAIIFLFFAFGAISETMRIMTSTAPDITPQRIYLGIMSFTMAFGIFWLTHYFWKKGT